MLYRFMNKTEKEVYPLSLSIKDLTPKMYEWINSTFDKDFARYNKRNGTFLEYFVIYQRVGDWQAIRYFAVRKRRSLGWEKELFEAMRFWIDKDGRQVTECRLRFWGHYILDNWDTSSPLQIRHRYSAYYNDIHNIDYTYVKVRSLIPELKRMRFTKPIAEPFPFTRDILADGRLEMLYRMGLKHVIMKCYPYFTFSISDNTWTALRIALRHHYDFSTKERADLWFDTINMVENLGLDVHNPHYVAPDDLKTLHDTLSNRLNRRRIKEDAMSQEKREKYDYKNNKKKAEKAYKKAKKDFLPIAFQNGKFKAHVLQSVKEFLDEGLAMHHCVFACKYYEKQNSVVLSIRNKNNKRLETCEVDVNKGIILQCYGSHDNLSEWHQEIKDFVTDNMWRFKQAAKEVAL